MLVQYFQQGIRIAGISAAKIMDGAMGSDKNRLGSLDLLQFDSQVTDFRVGKGKTRRVHNVHGIFIVLIDQAGFKDKGDRIMIPPH